MKYIVKVYVESDEVKYGVYSNEIDARCQSKDNGLILLLDDLQDAETICYILNKEDIGLKEMNRKTLNKNDFKIGDIVTIKNSEIKIGIIYREVGNFHYAVKQIDEKGNMANDNFVWILHKGNLNHK